jgi:hypothetical protein
VRVWKPVALAAIVVLLAAACGGGGGSNSGGGVEKTAAGVSGSGAAALPASTPAFVSLSTDFDSEQWQRIRALGAKFPGYGSLLAKGRMQLADQGLDFEQDVKPALGPEVDVAWLDLQSSDDFVVVTKPADSAKLDALVAKAKEPPARADVNGYAVLAQTKALVDSAAAATSRLADDPAFEEAMAALPGGDVVRLYLNGPQVQSALVGAASRAGSSGTPSLKLPENAVGQLQWVAASATAQQDGVRLDGALKIQPTPQVASFAATLPDEFAAGAIVYAGFANLDQAARKALDALGKSSPELNTQLGQLEGISGLSLDKDVAPLLKNEGGVAVYPSTEKVPTIVFALKVDDEKKVRKLLDQLGALAALGGGGGAPAAVSVPGYAEAKRVKLGETELFYGTTGGKLVVSNAEAGLREIGGSGPKLADDALFKAAKDGAEMPDRTIGFVYADLKRGLPLVLGLAESSGTKVPPAVQENTAPLQSALFYGTADGDVLRITGFAGIK